ncbi:DUF2474 family protein [Niveispirillum sp. KHB5.9]
MKPDITEDAPKGLGHRLVWFATIWLGSILALGLVALVLRAVLKM